jgi:polygalacturonase
MAVNGVVFSNSQILNSQNGARIKTNSGQTGTVNNVTYSNIQLSNISVYGIDIQQDYRALHPPGSQHDSDLFYSMLPVNGGPTGKPTNGVTITDIFMNNITGTVQSVGQNYYLLTASDTSASTWKFTNLAIAGGHNSTCLVEPSGFNC